MAGKTAILAVKILGDAKEAQKALDDTATSADKFQSGVTKAAVPAAAALAGLAAAGISAAKAAAEDQASATQLALALRNSAGASDASISATEDWITKTSMAAAVADDELRPALATLVRATGDTAAAQDLMTTALDVSAATGKDVESVSTALAKAYGGQTTGLKKLVPGMDAAVLASGDMEAIQRELARTTGGAAAEAAATSEGQMKLMTIAMAEAQEEIGSALLPAMSGLAKMLATVAQWVQKNSRWFLVVAGVIGVVAGAILALNVAFKAYAIVVKTISAATKIWAAVQWVLNSAFIANPITWIVIGIVALIAAIVLIATKTTWFQDIWAAAWGGIKAAAEAVWNWLVSAATIAWQLLVAGVKLYVGIYVAIFEGIKTAVGKVWNWIVSAAKAVWNVILAGLRGYINIYVSIFNGIRSAVGAVWDWLKSTASNALNAILAPIRAIESAFDRVVDAIRSVIDWLGRIKLPKVLTDIGGAIGGILGRSAPASVSTVSARTVPAAGVGVRSLSTRASSRSTRNDAPTIVVQGALDPVAVAKQIRLILRSDQRRRAGVVIS